MRTLKVFVPARFNYNDPKNIIKYHRKNNYVILYHYDTKPYQNVDSFYNIVYLNKI